MADRTTTPAKGKATPFPKEWSRMSTKAKQDWLAQNRPGHPQATKAVGSPAPVPAAAPSPPPAATAAPQDNPDPADEEEPAEQTPDEALQALCCAIANDVQSVNARQLLAQLLRGIAEQLDAGQGDLTTTEF